MELWFVLEHKNPKQVPGIFDRVQTLQTENERRNSSSSDKPALLLKVVCVNMEHHVR